MITLIISSVGYYIKVLLHIYLYSAGFIILNTWFGLDFGLSEFYVTLFDKLFKFVEKNEKLFLYKTHSSADHNGDNKLAADSQVVINGYTKSDIESCFKVKGTDHWNLLTSTFKPEGQNVDYQLTLAGKVLFTLGLIFRFGLLLPVRSILLVYTLLQTFFITFNLAYTLPAGKFRDAYYNFCWRLTFRLSSANFGCYFKYHQTHNCHQAGGIAVPNHTGPIDIICLGEHLRYSFLGRRRGGILGYLYSALEQSGGNVWFEPNEKEAIKKRLITRVHDPVSNPLVVFAEGTCTTTDSILRFRKGAFELGCPVYPVAIKYDLRFGNPFWNSKQIGFLQLCIKLFTNWSIVGDVHYLPPVTQKESESAIEFSERVRSLIADKIGLKKFDLDGYMIKYGCNNSSKDMKVQSREVGDQAKQQSADSNGLKTSFSNHTIQSLKTNGELITRSY